VERLVEAWDDGLAARLFSMNVALDEPLARRKAALERLATIHGPLQPDESEPAESDSPAHLAWWLVGERGCVRLEIRLSPEPDPRVQALDVTSIPEPAGTFQAAAATIVRLLGDDRPSWPAALELAKSVDRAAVQRELLAASARCGPASVGRCIAGDGLRKASWRISGERGDLELRLERESESGPLTAVTLLPKAIRAPNLAD